MDHAGSADMLALGSHCAVPECQQIDFLPFTLPEASLSRDSSVSREVSKLSQCSRARASQLTQSMRSLWGRTISAPAQQPAQKNQLRGDTLRPQSVQTTQQRPQSSEVRQKSQTSSSRPASAGTQQAERCLDCGAGFTNVQELIRHSGRKSAVMVLSMLPAAPAMYRRFPSCLTKAQASPDFTTRAAPGRGSGETRHPSSDIVIHRFCQLRPLLAFNLSHSRNCSSISYLLCRSRRKQRQFFSQASQQCLSGMGHIVWSMWRHSMPKWQ
ncbi:hypothetical protein WJX79_000415 [Trebouxia sp. C0005]